MYKIELEGPIAARRLLSGQTFLCSLSLVASRRGGVYKEEGEFQLLVEAIPQGVVV